MQLNHLERFRSITESGRTAYGCVLTSPDAGLAELAGEAGFDFAWIDLEHSPLPITDAAHLLMALRGTGCAPFIRVAWNVPCLLKPALDLAPAAVIIPMVNTAEEARRAAAACRYPADGGERGFATRRATGYGRMPLREYLEHSHGEPLVFVQIEHRDAVRNIDGILAAPGVDGVCIGPFDLSASYGKTGDFRDPEIAAAIDLVREKTLAAGLLLGGFCPDPEFWGTRFLHWKALSTDTDALFRAYRSMLQSQRSIQEEE